MEKFDAPPFAAEVGWKEFSKKSPTNITGHYGLENTPIILRRFTDENFSDRYAVMRKAYDRLSGYSHLGVPAFLAIRANVFEEVDARLLAHYVLVEQVFGENIQIQDIPTSQKDEMAEIADIALVQLSQYVLNLYNEGGLYDGDQQLHQYVLGKTTQDEQSKLYYVDLDHRFIWAYDATNRENPINKAFFQSLVRMNASLLISLQHDVSRPLVKARQKFYELMGFFMETSPHLATVHTQLLHDFEEVLK